MKTENGCLSSLLMAFFAMQSFLVPQSPICGFGGLFVCLFGVFVVVVLAFVAFTFGVRFFF